MFNTTTYLFNDATETADNFGAEYHVNTTARRLYFQAHQAARFAQRLARLTGRQPQHLAALRAVTAGRHITSQHDAGLQTVPLSQIQGSVDRADDFDAARRPLANSTQQGWLRVATARTEGQALPAVELIKIDHNYFVQDGHHRISVAQARGELDIGAKVTVWQLVPR
jgi:hypothetical protein